MFTAGIPCRNIRSAQCFSVPRHNNCSDYSVNRARLGDFLPGREGMTVCVFATKAAVRDNISNAINIPEPPLYSSRHRPHTASAERWMHTDRLSVINGAPILPLARIARPSNSKLVDLSSFALAIRRKIRPLVAEITFTMIAMGKPVIGRIKNAARASG
jgi:hypothetical protein